jgi:hypothetical protein
METVVLDNDDRALQDPAIGALSVRTTPVRCQSQGIYYATLGLRPSVDSRHLSRPELKVQHSRVLGEVDKSLHATAANGDHLARGCRCTVATRPLSWDVTQPKKPFRITTVHGRSVEPGHIHVIQRLAKGANRRRRRKRKVRSE